MSIRKLFAGVLVLGAGCGKSELQIRREAYFGECHTRGYSEDKVLSMQPGMEARYACGCSWKIGMIDSGRFGGCTVPPPKICYRHRDRLIGWKWPEDWKAEAEPNGECNDDR